MPPVGYPLGSRMSRGDGDCQSSIAGRIFYVKILRKLSGMIAANIFRKFLGNFR